MRISEYLLWFLLTFGSLFVVSAVLPNSWPERTKITIRMVTAAGFFLLIGAYWLTTGEKFDETAYRLILCRVHDFYRCNSQKDSTEAKRLEQEQRDSIAAAALPQEADSQGRLRAERERQRSADEARAREAEMERRRQEEMERQRAANEARQRAIEAERRLQEQRDRQKLADEAREREAEAARRAQEQRELELLSRRYGATAVGRVEATGQFFATSFINQQSGADAESRAIARCNQEASECKVVARFNGFGKCVFVASGTSITREIGRVRRHAGVRSAGTEAEALQKCQSDFQNCNVFHTRCNNTR